MHNPPSSTPEQLDDPEEAKNGTKRPQTELDHRLIAGNSATVFGEKKHHTEKDQKNDQDQQDPNQEKKEFTHHHSWITRFRISGRNPPAAF